MMLQQNNHESQVEDATLFYEIERKLSHLAAEWRGAGINGKIEKQGKIAVLYQDLLCWAMKAGYTDWLDAEAELPDELMPKEYLERQ